MHPPTTSHSSLPSSSSSSSGVPPSSRVSQTATPSTAPSTGSATQTITGTPAEGASIPVRLHLRGHNEELDAETTESRGRDGRPRIRWAEGTVDNEGMGKKSSKVCCIYHPPTAPGESSDESSSDSSSDSDTSDLDDGSARPVGGSRRSSRRHRHHHHDHDHDHADEAPGKGKGVRRPSPNAYEKQPRKAEVKR